MSDSAAVAALEFAAPIRVVSEMNTVEHWTKRRKARR